MSSQVNPPDLLIYLQADISTLVSHIQRRGRDYEGSMSLEYLKKLNERYEEWISGYTEGKLLVINVDNLDFQGSPEDLGEIVNQVSRELHGLFWRVWCADVLMYWCADVLMYWRADVIMLVTIQYTSTHQHIKIVTFYLILIFLKFYCIF